MGADVRKLQAMLAAALACLLLVLVGVASAAPPSNGGTCRPAKQPCATTTTSSTSRTSTTSTTTTSTTTMADTASPTVSITAPGQGATVDGVLSVSGTSSDDRSVSRVEVQVDGGAWRAAAGTTSWSTAVDTAAWEPGSSHRIAARAVDVAGNVSATREVVLQKAAPASTGGDASLAPATQGTWTAPEGVRIEVATAGAVTIREVYRMLLESSAAPGDFGAIAPTLTVKVQDTYASQAATTADSSRGVYERFWATIYLRGDSTMFARYPDYVVGHEYGHVWTLYHLYMTRQGDWSDYLQYRWANGDGSLRLGEDARLDSSYSWDRLELIADDYRLLLGSARAIAQRPTHLNQTIPHPADVPGLRDMFLRTWAQL